MPDEPASKHAMAIRDLWPATIIPSVVSPTAVLKVQGEKLRERTSGLIEGEVRGGADVENSFTVALDVFAPAIGVRVRLLTVSHDVDQPYPAKIQCEGFDSTIQSAAGVRDADSQLELEEHLHEAFSSRFVQSTLMSLIARSNERAS